MGAGWEEVTGFTEVSDHRDQHLCADLTFIAQHKLIYNFSVNKGVVHNQGINGVLKTLYY